MNDRLFERLGWASIVAAVFTASAVAWSVMLATGPPPAIESLDRRWLDASVRSRVGALTAVAMALDAVGLPIVSYPVRAVATVVFAWLRRWRDAAVFAATWLVSVSVSGLVKGAVDRGRPPDAISLVDTVTASYPSGHVIAAASTAVILVLILVRPGTRGWWFAGAAGATLLMAWSRVHLGVHWPSDAVGGALIGTAVALDCAVLADAIVAARRRKIV